MRAVNVLFFAMLIAGVTAAMALHTKRQPKDSLRLKVAKIAKATDKTVVSCHDVAKQHPLVLLALGQSNAGNHGEMSPSNLESIGVFADGKCFVATDPLPGATGNGGSIWVRLPRFLKEDGFGKRPITIAILAVDATTIDNWTNAQSPLPGLLSAQIEAMKQHSLPPDAILWQQGEAEFKNGTNRQEYLEGLQKLVRILDQAGSNAPVILAKSTLCPDVPNEEIRQAIELAPKLNARFHAGPDTDIISGQRNRIGCHMTTDGLESAARMWASAITREIHSPRVEGRRGTGPQPPWEGNRAIDVSIDTTEYRS